MDIEILLTILMQLGMFAGVMVLMVMFVMIHFKLTTQGKWYVELNDNGEIREYLVKESSQSRITIENGEYIIPATPRMHKWWPTGLPKILQTEVRHEKYIQGEEEPIELRDIQQFTNTAQNVNRLVNINLLKALGDMLDDNSSLELVLKRYAPWFVVAAIVLVGAAGAAAYLGYQTNQEMEALKLSISALVGEG